MRISRLLVTVLLCGAYLSGYCQNKENEHPLVACNLNISLSFEREFDDSLSIAKEKEYQANHSEDYPCILRERFHKALVRVHVRNIGKINAPIDYSFFGSWGTLDLDFYTIQDGKHIPLPFNAPDVDMIFDLKLPPGGVDSFFTATVATDYSKIDTGLYVMHGRYKQKCGDGVKSAETNYLHFRVIK